MFNSPDLKPALSAVEGVGTTIVVMIPKQELILSIKKAAEHQLTLQFPEGYWWYTLEANESICAEAIFLMYFLDEVDSKMALGLVKRVLSCQRDDGTWSLYHDGPADLSTTIECYWALKLVLCQPDRSWFDKHVLSEIMVRQAHHERVDELTMNDRLNKAREFILSAGGITKSRVFTKIHLAQFGLVPWSACPEMPAELMLMPSWAPVNIYEFSSWARACIVPLLVVLNKKPVRKFPDNFDLDELFVEPPETRDWSYKTDKFFLSWERFFIQLNKLLKVTSRIPFRPLHGTATERCEEWICEHVNKTEDIFPALAYGAIALSVLGHPNSHPVIRKAISALKSFQQIYEGDKLPATCAIASSAKQFPAKDAGDCHAPFDRLRGLAMTTHQQCCISPVWDTPWQLTALLNASVPADHPQLLKAGRWLISKQVTKTYGDWKVKNPKAEPGGWSFEFENEYFPDVDDTIQVLHVLNRLALPDAEKQPAIARGFNWLMSMQNDDGGWGAFDRNQTFEVVNKIPFSDHGACLDPSSPDVTARALALIYELSSVRGEPVEPPTAKYSSFDKLPPRRAGRMNGLAKGIKYLIDTQESFGGWFGRWGVNYIYGTWCALTALSDIHVAQVFRPANMADLKVCATIENAVKKAADWLVSIQHEDGGWSESPESYKLQRYVPYPPSYNVVAELALPELGKASFATTQGIPSQTAWAVMGLIASQSGRVNSATTDVNVVAKLALPNLGRVNSATTGDEAISQSIDRGIKFLVDKQKSDGTWDEPQYTGTGFPGHFYIRYHGYRHFFPLLALGKAARNL